MNNEYIDDGDFAINSTNDPDVFRGSIVEPGETTKRLVKLQRTKSGHLMGFIQPLGPDEELALKAFRNAERRQDVDLSNLPDGVSARYESYEGKPSLVYSLDDVVAESGKPFELRPGQVIVFDRLEKAVKFREDKASGQIAEGQKPPAAFSGFAATFDGKVTTPAAWIQIAKHDKDGNLLPISKQRVFFSGTNKAFDRNVYLEAKGHSGDDVPFDV